MKRASSLTPSPSESSVVSDGDRSAADRSGSVATEDLRTSSPDLPPASKLAGVKGQHNPSEDKENDPTRPPFTQRPFTSTPSIAHKGKKGEGASSRQSPSPKPKRKGNPDPSDSGEELPPKKKCMTKCVRKDFDIKTAFTDDCASREEFQDKILAAIHSGNEVLQQSAKETAEFQCSFLTVLNNLASK